MLHLNPNSIKIIKAKRDFRIGMLDFVYKRIKNIKNIQGYNTYKIENFFTDILNKYIEEILIGDPRTIQSINEQIKPYIYKSADIRKGIEHVFNYNLFIKKRKKRYDAYRLAESLDISTCLYCNRNYTNTVIKSNGEKLTRPQFDHYFDKASNPLLAVSFFNLIPSCSICNSSIKGTIKMNLNDYLHPYLDNKINDIRFTFKYTVETKTGLRVEVVSPDNLKARNTIKAFAIEQVYNSHTGELHDLIKTRQYFSDKYLGLLNANLLKDISLSKEDLYRIVFGAEYELEKYANRPFSKFKSDILKELGII